MGSQSISPSSVTAQKTTVLLLVVLFATIFKLWLIGRVEIADSVYDPVLYVEQILDIQNGGLQYGPGTGLVGLLLKTFGIPFRMGMELGYLIASFTVIGALIQWPHKTVLACVLYIITIFNPSVEGLLSSVMSDQVWLIEVMLGLSLFVLAYFPLHKCRWPLLIGSSLFLSLSTITRTTFVTLMLSLTLLALFLFLLRKQNEITASRINRLLPIALVSAVISLIYYGTCYYNQSQHGYFGISMTDCNEYKSFYLCLQSVGDSSGDPYYPIDAKRRSLIATAGPNSKQFIDAFEHNDAEKSYSEMNYGKHDVATAWFSWTAFDIYKGDIPRTLSSFKAIQEEILDAKHNNKLPTRLILPLPDSRIHLVLTVLPSSLQRAATKVVYQPDQLSSDWDAAQFKNPAFSNMLSRRSVTPNPLCEALVDHLCRLYSYFYSTTLLYLFIGIFICFFALCLYYAKEIPERPDVFLVRQIFLLNFVVVFGWYAWFDASGIRVESRHLIYQNVLLPVLFAYYTSHLVCIVRRRKLSF